MNQEEQTTTSSKHAKNFLTNIRNKKNKKSFNQI